MTLQPTNPGPAATPQLELRGIVKQYPGTLANDDIDLTVMPGEVHALLGENGAGKSTLVKIIYAVVQADAGEIYWNGERLAIGNPARARHLGIGMVFQHFNLFDTLTVAENIALCVEDSRDLAKLAERVSAISARYGLPIDPRRHVHTLSVGERQRVEIIRCLLQKPKLLIMDEPTSVLTPQEVEVLFKTLRRLAGEGCSILYISHKLDEIKELCERATVLRGGKVTATCDPRQETPKSLAEMMIGSELPVCQNVDVDGRGEVCLEVDGLSLPADDPFGIELTEIYLDIRGGEIVGIAGVAGNGQKELLQALSGERKATHANDIRITGVPAGHLPPGHRRGEGLAFVPEERLGRGAVPEMSMSDNTLLTAYQKDMVRSGFIQFERIDEYCNTVVDDFNVVCAGNHAEARSLSGGNLQKFIIGREILLGPKLMILAYPTWGVDVGAATLVRQAIIDLRNKGTAVLVVSEDLEELFEISNRIAVISNGRLSPARRTCDTDVEEVGRWMAGIFDAAGTGGGHHAA
ncbi:MAG TPA: ABC transporter ATP-binding protein [Rhodospirillales bacterium]|nr:ABC transporter ATP-binding protein [Rhodospirillales bacterium]